VLMDSGSLTCGGMYVVVLMDSGSLTCGGMYVDVYVSLKISILRS
jgi:hypothetical protein